MEKTALVTGCSSGIGRATAEAFHSDEWTVYATARDTDDVAGLAELGCETAELDVTDDDDCQRVIERIIETEGRIDALVNNAGYGQHGPLEDVPTRYFEKQFAVNVISVHRLTRRVLKYMREAGRGTIVNVSSVAGRLATPGMGAYAASKHAVEGYSDALRQETDNLGVDVVVVQPGPVETDFRDRVDNEIEKLQRTDDYEWVYDLQTDGSILGGEGPFAVPPSEVAEAILDAAVSPDPDPRYVVGSFARATLYASYLPDRIRDRLFALFRKVT